MRPWMLICLLLLSLLIHETEGKRLIRKLGSPPNGQHISHNQNDKNKEKTATKEESLAVSSSSTMVRQQPVSPEAYPGILDIAGMDYSQARRRPPIHN